jgi:hypothetical protein
MERKAMTPLTPLIEVPAGQTDPASFRITFRLTNQTAHNVAVPNPNLGKPTPAMRWPWSNETYQISLLISFHHLSMSVTDEAGRMLPEKTIQTWATPAELPKLDLAPGESFELSIPIGNFYELASGDAYSVAIEYGDRDVKVAARTFVTVP